MISDIRYSHGALVFHKKRRVQNKVSYQLDDYTDYKQRDGLTAKYHCEYLERKRIDGLGILSAVWPATIFEGSP